MLKKIFCFLFILISFVCFINLNNCFASYDIDVNNQIYNLPDLPEGISEKYFFIISNLHINNSQGRQSMDFFLFVSDEPFNANYVSDNVDDSYSNIFQAVNGHIYSLCYYVDGGEQKYYYWSLFMNSNSLATGHRVHIYNSDVDYTDNKPKVLFTSHNITLTGDNETVLFQSAPLGEEQTTLNIIATSMDFSQVLMEVLAMLPILLVILISYLSFRKAIQILFRTLHSA